MKTASEIFESLTALLQRNNISTDAAEVQGILVGMLAGGMPLESQDWKASLADFTNQGAALSNEIVNVISDIQQQNCQQLVEAEFALSLILPDDAAPINERGRALINWIQGFMLGFGLHQADLTKCSADVKEALEDFSEISRMDDEMSEDEESEQALSEVMEYVRISAMLCFNELGQSADQEQATPKTIH
ncbi:UPF0149 family protein [Neptunicella marina]|uniref:UPF0149 family protein n=1 Tax=Neptunicella marina TaxID=2125989 RepID=A0A8J6M2X5_9ALTE|nr:UPF0149 family protein [Neptunicella marina]MBC3766853.1 UPF0149 family protein [Neptunicella marina]